MTQIKFTINGNEYKVENCDASVSLNSYLRNHANLRGTKSMCHEGGCGACIVSVSKIHPLTNELESFAVNSCLVSILSCHNWAITTVEGIGNRKSGYHPIQSRLAGFNGTQCGFCTPGWVMNMYSLYSSTEDLTMQQIEDSFGGNICRCTGYRPILDAFKSFSVDASSSLKQKVVDIEDAFKPCAKSGSICSKTCTTVKCHKTKYERSNNIEIVLKGDEQTWYKVFSIENIFNILEIEGDDSYMLVAGNTARGIYHMKDLPKLIIDISSVSELKGYKINENLKIGGSTTLNEFIIILESLRMNPSYPYATQFVKHLKLVAHIPVRNIGTIAGNLIIKHQHQEFPSDLFLLFEAIGATITIAERKHKKFETNLNDFLNLDMKGRIIYEINLPSLTPNHIFYSYKVMPRAQNSHAHINAAFLFEFNNEKTEVKEARIVYGGVNPEFIHPYVVESVLIGSNLFSNNTLQMAMKILDKQIMPNICPPEPSPDYRKKLCLGLFYKFVLHICPSNLLREEFKSGGDEFVRPVSSGKQDFETNKKIWPLNQPIPKIESVVQCSGEAAFVNDLPTMPNECYAAFVLSTIHKGFIDHVDKSTILNEKGAIAVFTSEDIPGKNNYSGNDASFVTDEEILSSGEIGYYGQPLAIVVAETEQLARLYAERVQVTYKNRSKEAPILTIRDALKSNTATERVAKCKKVEATERGDEVKRVIKGKLDIFGQYHYSMETQTCVCVPIEDGMDVYPSSQWMDLVNIAISEALNVPLNSINIKVRRLGGAYGSKISRCSQISTACAIAAKNLNRPVRFVMPLESNMAAVGKRFPLASDYEIGVDDDGRIQYLNNIFYQDDGFTHNESVAQYTTDIFCGLYDSKRWNVESNSVLTDTASNTWCRAPGTTEAVAMIECMMDHIAAEMNLDPIDVRIANMDINYNPLPSLIDDIKTTSNFNERLSAVKQFNSLHRWNKRGISLIPLKYNVNHWGTFTSYVCIYQGDGSVAVSHAGIEVGQGLNSKVAQVCAHTLGVPLELISIKPTNNFIGANATSTGGSVSSEICCYATKRACEMLLERLAPIKDNMDRPTWSELIKKAYESGVDLAAHHTYSTADGIQPYIVWAVSVIEVEVDMLTGTHNILRVDILEDAGDSLSPLIDIGQVEGAFVMGLGYWTSEQLIYDKDTGQLLTNRTWNYKPPGAKDIPIDFRVQFRRNAKNPAGVLGSKATGEPPLNLAYGVVSAIRQAITAVKVDNGLPADKFYHIDMPCTPEHIVLAADIDYENFIL